MAKKSFSLATVLMVAVLAFLVGVVLSKGLSPAALSIPFLSQPVSATHTCIDQKCITVTAQCSADNDCATHMACNSQKQCVSENGAGANQCLVANDCALVKNPQQWCTTHNAGMNSVATIYANGNFSCNCYSTTDVATRAQQNCKEQYQNQ